MTRLLLSWRVVIMRWIDCRDQSSLGSYLCGRTGAAVIIENSVFACVTSVCCESSPILRNSDASQGVSWDWLSPDEDLHRCHRLRKRAIWSTVTLNSSHWIILVTWIDYLQRFVSRYTIFCCKHHNFWPYFLKFVFRTGIYNSAILSVGGGLK